MCSQSLMNSQVILLPLLCLLWCTSIIGLGLGFLRMREKFCNASSNVLLNVFNKMNSNLAYFDVSHNIEILHLNDYNEFENKINK